MVPQCFVSILRENLMKIHNSSVVGVSDCIFFLIQTDEHILHFDFYQIQYYLFALYVRLQCRKTEQLQVNYG